MRFLIAAGLALVAVLAQSTLGGVLSPALRADWVLVLVMAWAMLVGANEGTAVGFVAGILLDSVSATPFGVSGATLGVTGYGVGLGQERFHRASAPFLLGTVVVVTLLFHTGQLLLLQALGASLPPIERVYEVALVAGAWNTLLFGPAFLLCRRLIRLLTGWRQLKV